VLTPRAVELASGPNYAVLATVMPSGHPQAHVMWVDTDGDHVIVNTVVGRRKYRNMMDNPLVSLTIISRDDWFDWVEVQGTVAEVVTGPRAWEHIEELSQKYFDGPFGGPRVERAIIKIAPDRVVEHG
jgi:PPOX class probable F420-dependent enzyme